MQNSVVDTTRPLGRPTSAHLMRNPIIRMVIGHPTTFRRNNLGSAHHRQRQHALSVSNELPPLHFVHPIFPSLNHRYAKHTSHLHTPHPQLHSFRHRTLLKNLSNPNSRLVKNPRLPHRKYVGSLRVSNILNGGTSPLCTLSQPKANPENSLTGKSTKLLRTLSRRLKTRKAKAFRTLRRNLPLRVASTNQSPGTPLVTRASPGRLSLAVSLPRNHRPPPCPNFLRYQ
jgi:hypothetical protein